jgi:hypothetical protein
VGDPAGEHGLWRRIRRTAARPNRVGSGGKQRSVSLNAALPGVP